MKKIKKIMVPASSANLGSGFDSIGLCLDLWNAIEFHKSKFKISISGEAKNFSTPDITDPNFACKAGRFGPAYSHPTIEISKQYLSSNPDFKFGIINFQKP